MSFLTEWVTNIILFILLALVVDMLLPNSSMKKYSKMVISLLLMVVIITPIFRIMSYDLPQAITDLNFPYAIKEEQIKNEFEIKKKEIQAQNDAYILEQMAVQMETVAEEELIKRHGLTIESIQLSTKEGIINIQSEQDLEQIKVTIANNDLDEEVIETIKPIKVDLTEEKPKETAIHQVLEREVMYDLAHIWGVEKERIIIHLEGGEDER